MTYTQKTVLIAGATGYLGHFLMRAYAEAGYKVRALARSPEKLTRSDLWIDDVFVGEATKSDTLKGCCKDVDLVVSAIGITRQKDGLTYDAVDYQANSNLLSEAISDGVKQFAYVHVLHAERMPNIAMAQAKAKFAAELENAPIASTILCPSGFFSDLEEILQMAERGRVYLFGDGNALISPIHGEDLAQLCVEATVAGLPRVEAGGPDALTQNQIAKLAFAALGTRPRISHVPLWLGRAGVGVAKAFGFRLTIGALEFFLAASSLDMSAEPHGSRRLSTHFENQHARSETTALSLNTDKATFQ